MWEAQVDTDAEQYFFHGDPLVLPNVIIVGADAQTGGGIHAFDRSNGQEHWMHPAGKGVPGAISVSGESAYAISMEDDVLAIDVRSGKLQWSFPLEVGGWLTPTAAVEHVYAGGRDGIVYALDAETGRVEWQTRLDVPVRTSVVATTTGLYVGTNDGTVFRIDPQDGSIQASHRLDTELSPRWLGVANGSLLALLADEAEDYRALVAVDLQLRGARWRQTTTPRWTTTRVFVFKDMTVLGTPAGEVEAYCLADGRKAWSQRVEGTVRAIGGSEDVLYVGTTQGSLYALTSTASCSGA